MKGQVRLRVMKIEKILVICVIAGDVRCLFSRTRK